MKKYIVNIYSYSVPANTALSLMYGFYILCLSLFLYDYYLSGDLETYNKAYDALHNQDGIYDAFSYYRKTFFSAEPVYFLVNYVVSFFIEKNYFYSFVNAGIGYMLCKWMLDKKVNVIVVLFSFFNFYLWVLYLPAERLKLGMFFFMLAFSYQGKGRLFLYLSALFSHFQIFVNLVCMACVRFNGDFKETIKSMYLYFLMIAVILTLVVLFFEPIRGKIFYYYNLNGGIGGILKPLLFMLAALYYKPEFWKKIVLAFSPILVASMIVGSDRLAMIAYFLSMYFVLQHNNGLNFFTLITSLYFSIKTILFMDNVFIYQNGFH
jgi:hypothetical protein